MKSELPDGILKQRDNAEYRLQVHCIDYLHGRKRIKGKTYPITIPFPQLWHNGNQRFSHIPTSRDAEQGFYLKQMGLRSGILDLILWWEAGIHLLDLKATTGLTKEQRQFCADMARVGIKTATANSVASFRDQLIAWGLQCENPLVMEPPASKEVQQLAYLDTLRPI